MRSTTPSARHPRRATPAAAAAAALLTLTACGGAGGGAEQSGDQSDIEAALQEETTLTFWSWAPEIDQAVEVFEEEYPAITVEVVDSGQSAEQYTNLQNTIRAGSGGPDVAQIEYFALPQFALTESVVELGAYGFADYEEEFTASAWEQVQVGEGTFGVPQDTGPLALFYNHDLLEEAGIDPPGTWAEFADAAERFQEENPDSYFTAIDPGDAGMVDSLLWQAGSRPFAMDGAETVSLDLGDEGAQRFSDTWTALLEDGLVEPTPMWTEEWWRGMATGRYATWIAGAWAPGAMATTMPEDAAGDWRVAPLPAWEEGDPVTAENGGSSTAVMAQSENRLAAIGFAQWLNTDPEAVRVLNETGLFPATADLLGDPEYLEAEHEFFGGQRINEVLVESSENVAPGWQYLPVQVYANSVFIDTAGQSITEAAPVADGLTAWQEQIGDYAAEQGFTVETP
ncbi:ABC transporter substrate-binding protein [Nocardiopsis sediminis]|uniref:ABC transporter substrate-binding protein n=1 Tax=Nocardiopsis sediminis TaxID=1778267 RepID=A0ABV8FNK8_9ACTN